MICPTTLIANWVREIGKFASGLSVMVHRGADRARLHRELQRAQVVITTYDTVVNDLVLFKAINWSYVICDEAQAMKKSGGTAPVCCCGVAAKVGDPGHRHARRKPSA